MSRLARSLLICGVSVALLALLVAAPAGAASTRQFAIVQVRSYWQGAGVIITPDGLVVTVGHLFAQPLTATHAHVRIAGRASEVAARLLALWPPYADLAWLQLPITPPPDPSDPLADLFPWPYLPVGCEKPWPGARVALLVNSTQRLIGTVGQPVRSPDPLGLPRPVTFGSELFVVRFAVPLHKGFSGGALLFDDRVVGLLSKAHAASPTFGLVEPIPPEMCRGGPTEAWWIMRRAR